VRALNPDGEEGALLALQTSTRYARSITRSAARP